MSEIITFVALAGSPVRSSSKTCCWSLGNDAEAGKHASYLLDLGEGRISTNGEDLPPDICSVENSIEDFVKSMYDFGAHDPFFRMEETGYVTKPF